MAAPLLVIVTVWTLIEEPDHPGTSVFLLVSALLIDRFADRAPGGSPRRWWLAPAVCVILAAGQMGDATALYVGVPAVVLASGYQILARRDASWLRRARSADGALILAALVSVPLEKAVRAVMTSLGGYQMVAPKTALASPAQWPRNVVVVFGVLRSLFGAVSAPGMRLGLAGTTLGWAGLAAAVGGTVWVAVRWRKSSRAEHLVVLVLLLNLAVFVVSKGAQADGYREIAAVLPCGAVLGARAIVPAIIAGKRKALAVAVAVVLVAVSGHAGRRIRAEEGEKKTGCRVENATARTNWFRCSRARLSKRSGSATT